MTRNERFQLMNLAKQLKKHCDRTGKNCEDCPFRMNYRCAVSEPCRWRLEDERTVQKQGLH